MRRIRRRVLVPVVILVVLLVGVTLFLTVPRSERFTLGPTPTQFHEQLDPALDGDYRGVLGVAHNAGNTGQTTTTAIEHGADVLETDVISVRGELVAGRDAPLPWLSDHLFRGPSLDTVWDRAADVPVLKLDLQRNDERLLDQVVAFLEPRPAARRVMISTRSADALAYLRPKLPGATLLFSVPNPDAFARLQSDAALQRAINGVSIFQGLVDAPRMSWLRDRALISLAWTVNDAPRLNAVVRLGVDGVTTNNLAVLEALADSPPVAAS